MKFIEFTVKNFKIFKDEVTFSMNAREGEFTFKENDENLLRAALIYGPNASGKSSLMQAIGLMMEIVQKSDIASVSLPYSPFILSTVTRNNPTFFEIVFSLDDKVYRYNFSYISDEIIEENLLILNNDNGGQNMIIFSRTKEGYEFSNHFQNNWGGVDLTKVTKKESLLLSKAIRENHPIAVKIGQEFKKINVVGTNTMIESDDFGYGYTINKIKSDTDLKVWVLDCLRRADFNIVDLKVEETSVPQQVQLHTQIPVSKVDSIKFIHPVFNEDKENAGFEEIFNGDESFGTNKFLGLAGPIKDILDKGSVIFIDELDRSLHPLLTMFIFDIFQNKNINKNDAQLIATTHDITLISSENKNNIDKYQVWFTEKNKYGEGSLFCLNDFEGLRNDTEYAMKYLQGRFGALPYISSYNESQKLSQQ